MSVIGTSARRSRAATRSRPRRQVVIWTTSTTAISNGNQPPWGIFGTLAARKARSTASSGRRTIAAFVGDHPKRDCTTLKNSNVVIAIVAVTAMP